MRTAVGFLSVTIAFLLALFATPLFWHIVSTTSSPTEQESYFVVIEIAGVALSGWRVYAVATCFFLIVVGLVIAGIKMLRPAVRGD